MLLCRHDLVECSDLSPSERLRIRTPCFVTGGQASQNELSSASRMYQGKGLDGSLPMKVTNMDSHESLTVLASCWYFLTVN